MARGGQGIPEVSPGLRVDLQLSSTPLDTPRRTPLLSTKHIQESLHLENRKEANKSLLNMCGKHRRMARGVQRGYKTAAGRPPRGRTTSETAVWA
jgi:hypothetical protein